MAAVYRALDEATGAEVAFKLLHAQKAADRQARTLFEREYHTLVGLKHPRIIEVYAYGLSDVGPFYTMELLEGADLRQLAPLGYGQACRYLRDIASSLALLHAKRLLHRDLSPRNVRLTSDGSAKLIDFGALASFGWNNEIIGTAPFIAPEALLATPLEQQADLFSLGALAYWLLTGTHAYPARAVCDLFECWRKPPPPPSALIGGIPEALDALVMSLLSIEPVARPGSAAVVIDALGAIAGLAPQRHAEEAESYLSSGALVGRGPELERLAVRLEQARAGQGSAVVIEADAGLGRTRLLNELALRAQLNGLVLLKADGEAEPGVFGVVTRLAGALLRALPEDARRTAAPYAPVLGHVSAALRAQLGNPPLAAIPAVGSEARAAVQYALLGWFHAVASEHPLVVAIDNVHAIDEHSAVLAAALAKQAPAMRLLLVATYRSMAGRDEASALSILRKNAGHLRLRGLNESEVSELVAGLFGKTDDSRRLAKRLYERSAGSPYECMELLRYAVSRRVVRYVDGTWVLPPDIAVAELPARYDEVLAARLGTLGRGAVRVAEALSIQSGSVSLALCLRLTDDMSEGLVYRALDELVAGEVLLLGDGSYRFCHDIQRQALCERLDGRRRQELHRALAAALTESGKRDVPTQLEIGWHLLRGGEESRGADMLAKIGIHRELPREHAERAVRGLQAALEVYEREGRSQYECAGVLLALVNLSYFVNFEVPRRLGQRAVEIGLRLTGLKCARELRPLLGTKLALSVCLAIAWLRFARFRKRAGHAGGVQYSLEEGISMLCTGGLVCMATFAACLDTNVVERLEDELEPLGYFGPSHVGSVVYDFCVGLAEYTRSPGNAYAGFVRRVSVLGTPGSVRGLPEASRPAMQGGNFQMVGLTQAFQHGPAALETAEQIEGLGFKMQLASAAQVRVLYYAHRGELKLVEQNRERFEIYAMQCGSTWQAELWRPAVMRVPYFLARDTVNLRRTYEQLARQAETIPSFELYARCVHGYYLISRGDVSAGRRVMERVVQQMPAGRKFGWQDARAALATALNALGEHAGARAACLEALQHMRPFDRTLVAHSGEVERQLALADAGLGEHARALERIEALLREHAHGDNPLCMGLLHAARAEIAIAMGDAATFAPHLAEMERWFKGTENPALLAQCERLRDRGTKAGCHRPTAFAPTAASASYLLQSRRVAELTAIHSLFDPGATRSDLLRRVLERALFASGAASGHLFLCANREMELAASYPDQPPLDGLKAQLSQLLLEEERTVQVAALDAAASEPGAAGDHECTDTAQSFVMNVEVLGCSYRIVPLLVRRDGTARCVGAVAIEDSSAHALRVDSDFFFALADALCDHLRADSNHSVSHRRQLSTATPESVAERNERMDS